MITFFLLGGKFVKMFKRKLFAFPVSVSVYDIFFLNARVHFLEFRGQKNCMFYLFFFFFFFFFNFKIIKFEIIFNKKKKKKKNIWEKLLFMNSQLQSLS